MEGAGNIVSELGLISIQKGEGEFTIIHVNGFYDKPCPLSVHLADEEGRVYGGAVGRTLIAGGPTQIMIATYMTKKVNNPAQVAEAKAEGETDHMGCDSPPPPSPSPPLPVYWKEFDESEYVT